jgi:SAM-dependent methyltransferase
LNALNFNGACEYWTHVVELGRPQFPLPSTSDKAVSFLSGDILDLGLPAESFDAVICVFGIFFVPDMEAAVRELWRLVKPNGRLAVTTWGPRFFEPVNKEFWNSVRLLRPELYKGFNPWDRITEPDAIRELFANAGVDDVVAVAEAGTHAIGSPEDWWTMVMGSGYRGTIEQLAPDDRDRVRRENLAFIERNKVRAVEANVVYAVAVRN